MNLVQMHNRVDFWADKVRSPRYRKDTRDDAVNIAIDAFIKDRYDNIKNRGVEYSFEIVERVREELNTILVDNFPLALVGTFAPTPTDFQYQILTYVFIGGKRVLCNVKSYVESDLSDNAFSQPDNRQPIHRRTATGFEFDAGPYPISSARMWYLKYPAIVEWNQTAIVAGATVLTIGNSYTVVSGTVTVNGVTYVVGNVFIALSTTMTGTGTVNPITNSDLPVTSHEEVCKIAAAVITGTFEDYSKSKYMDKEVFRS